MPAKQPKKKTATATESTLVPEYIPVATSAIEEMTANRASNVPDVIVAVTAVVSNPFATPLRESILPDTGSIPSHVPSESTLEPEYIQ
jgi:hypothetical protein